MEFNNLTRQYSLLKDSINQNIEDVLASGNFILGNKVSELEKNISDFVGVKYSLGCSSGTDALMLIFMALGVGKGDAIFCPDMTFIASIEPACVLGATPIFCDIDSKTYNISPKSLERQIDAVIKEGILIPKAIVAVDFLGNPADYNSINAIADKYGLVLIEDGAQSMGASFFSRKCGSLGKVAATSFYPSKPLGAYGDGGAVFTNDEYLYELMKSIRVHGKGIDKYHNVRIGLNARLDELQAAILLPKLDIIDNEIKIRQEKAKIYEQGLNGKYNIPFVSEGSISSYAQYSIMTDSIKIRTELIERMKNNKIPTILYYPCPLHLMDVFKNSPVYGEKFENAIDYSQRHIGIPFSPYISDEEQEKVMDVLLEE